MRARRGTRLGLLLGLLVLALAAAPVGSAQTPPPIDPQNPGWQPDMTWDDYTPVPGTDWANPAIQPTVRKCKVALVVVDYPDQPFMISQPPVSTIFGNPQPLPGGVGPIPSDDVPEFYRDFLNTPSMLNHFQTMNRYWMEDSFGKYGVQLDAFGPYRMPVNIVPVLHAPTSSSGNRALPDADAGDAVQQEHPHRRARRLARGGRHCRSSNSYDNIFYVGAGQDESGTWQEFGEMKFRTQDDGHRARSARTRTTRRCRTGCRTRYVPWTSWAVRRDHLAERERQHVDRGRELAAWPSTPTSSRTTSGSPDNYNNPFGDRRSSAPRPGTWDMMSRGSFNGPGGTHTRWLIPPTHGRRRSGSQAQPAQQARSSNFLTDAQIAAAEPQRARRVRHGGGGGDSRATSSPADRRRRRRPDHARRHRAGRQVAGLRRRPRTPLCPARTRTSTATRWRSSSGSAPTRSRPGHGVLISKTKTSESSSCGTFTCFVVDHRRAPGGHQQGRLRPARRHADEGDDRRPAPAERRDVQRRAQLGLAVRVRGHARTGSTSTSSTWRRTRTACSHYTVGVRSLDGAGPQTRGVALAGAADQSAPRPVRDLHVHPDQHGRAGDAAGEPAPAGRLGVPRQRHLPALRRLDAAPAGRPSS